MTLWPTAGNVVASLSGLLFIGLAVAVVSVRPRRRPQLLFAAFAVPFGLVQFVLNMVSNDPLGDHPLYVPALNVLFLAAVPPLAILGVTFPGRPPLNAATRTAGLLAAVAVVAWAFWSGFGSRPLDSGSGVLMLTFTAVGVVLPLRFRSAAPGSRGRSQIALMAAALPAWPAAIAASALIPPDDPTALVGSILMVAMLLAGAMLWLLATGTPDAPGQRLARNLALLTLGLLTFSVAAMPWLRASDVGTGLLFGAARVLSVGLLAYAILRHQLFGLDVKLKWTLKQSTVAAAFVGVFFVVSESAATFFSGSGLGPYMGIAAAGLLVFAMAPLQRAAERVASAAMPGVKGIAEMDPRERAQVYYEACARAWADGSVSRDERGMLQQLRASLGLDGETALRIEESAAREGQGEGAP